jgi:hypothetical protein
MYTSSGISLFNFVIISFLIVSNFWMQLQVHSEQCLPEMLKAWPINTSARLPIFWRCVYISTSNSGIQIAEFSCRTVKWWGKFCTVAHRFHYGTYNQTDFNINWPKKNLPSIRNTAHCITFSCSERIYYLSHHVCSGHSQVHSNLYTACSLNKSEACEVGWGWIFMKSAKQEFNFP